MTSKIENNLNSTIVIVGGNGDLSLRKLLPALYNLEKRGLLDKVNRVIGTGRADFSQQEFLDLVTTKYLEFVCSSIKGIRSSIDEVCNLIVCSEKKILFQASA